MKTKHIKELKKKKKKHLGNVVLFEHKDKVYDIYSGKVFKIEDVFNEKTQKLKKIIRDKYG